MNKLTSKESKIQSQTSKTSNQCNVETGAPFMTDNKLFNFYLDAWNYCRQHNIDLKRIRKVDWKTWEVFV